MPKLNVKAKRECMWDLVSLGEVMLRLDPGDERISTTRHFRAWEGGGEYNVARGLKRCFGMDTAIVTALADNPIGRLVEDLMLQGGVSQKYVRWAPYDGVGRTVRNGLNFTERAVARPSAALTVVTLQSPRSKPAKLTGIRFLRKTAFAGFIPAESFVRSRRARRLWPRKPWKLPSGPAR